MTSTNIAGYPTGSRTPVVQQGAEFKASDTHRSRPNLRRRAVASAPRIGIGDDGSYAAAAARMAAGRNRSSSPRKRRRASAVMSFLPPWVPPAGCSPQAGIVEPIDLPLNVSEVPSDPL
jgi:hypothetical protein